MVNAIMSAEVMFFIGPFPSKKRQLFVLVRCIYIACRCIEDWQSACHKLSHLILIKKKKIVTSNRVSTSSCAVTASSSREQQRVTCLKRGEGKINKGEKKKRERYDLLYSTSGVAVCQIGNSMHSSVFLLKFRPGDSGFY